NISVVGPPSGEALARKKIDLTHCLDGTEANSKEVEVSCTPQDRGPTWELHKQLIPETSYKTLFHTLPKNMGTLAHMEIW
ncbi:Hypothetical predicted protein, partial [Pelobates cultripes]